MTFADAVRRTIPVRRAQDPVPAEMSRRLAQYRRRLDEHRARIDYLEGALDDAVTDIGDLTSRLSAVERRLVELHVATAIADTSGEMDSTAETVTL